MLNVNIKARGYSAKIQQPSSIHDAEDGQAVYCSRPGSAAMSGCEIVLDFLEASECTHKNTCLQQGPLTVVKRIIIYS